MLEKDNIKYYNSHNILCEMKKTKARDAIKFIEDLNDKWFIYAIKYNIKSGEINQNHMIIASDYNTWIRHFERDGFEKKI